MSTRRLTDLLDASARRFPDKIAVSVPGGRQITYAELARVTDRLRDRLVALGVRHGDRVGFRLHKSIDSVVSLFGIMKAGAAYVPVDAEGPAPRGAYILNDCQVKVVITEQDLAPALVEQLQQLIPARMPYGEAKSRARRIAPVVVASSFERFARLARAHGVAPAVLALNVVVDDVPREVPMRDAIERAGLPLFDLFDVFPEPQRPALRVAPWDDHPNAEGHRLVADRLVSELKAFLASGAADRPGTRATLQ